MNMPYINTPKWERTEPPSSFNWWFVLAVVVATLLALAIALPIWAQEPLINLEVIKMIESNGDPFAYNERTRCYGLYQISEICLEEYNQFNKTNYNITNLFMPEIAEKIARWYFEVRIPQMLKYYHKPVTVENCIIAYNAGIQAVVKGYTPKETRVYLRKYAQLAKR